MYCKNCGMKLEEGAKFCGGCGMPVDNEIFEFDKIGKKQEPAAAIRDYK